jgi:hypothetical protein
VNYTLRNEASDIVIAIGKLPGENKLPLAIFRHQLHPEPLSQCCDAKKRRIKLNFGRTETGQVLAAPCNVELGQVMLQCEKSAIERDFDKKS